MNPRVVVTLTAADLERERPNLERGSVVGAGLTSLERGALCDVELVFPSGARMTVPARAVLTRGASTVFAFEAFDRETLLELIVGNPAWLQVAQVRRALLANPRLSPDMITKVLLLLSRDELQLVPQITAYPTATRMAAKAMVKR